MSCAEVGGSDDVVSTPRVDFVNSIKRGVAEVESATGIRVMDDGVAQSDERFDSVGEPVHTDHCAGCFRDSICNSRAVGEGIESVGIAAKQPVHLGIAGV